MRALQPLSSDLIHGIVVTAVCLMATVYVTITHDHSNNVWIVYGSSIAYAAGRAGASVASTLIGGRRADDPTQNVTRVTDNQP